MSEAVAVSGARFLRCGVIRVMGERISNRSNYFRGNDEILSYGQLSEKQKPLRRHSRAGGNLEI